ncbi:hypothetical protein PWT90_00998 [Aphanocladium album]|nr:hypothetical protein PWT90_00998 [Aphanocladium album]
MHAAKLSVLASTSLFAIALAKQYDNWNILSGWQVEIQEPIKSQLMAKMQPEDCDFKECMIFDRMKTRLDKAARIGCDGVDPDNIDLSTVNWGNGKTVTDDATVKALKRFAAYAHNLTTKNGNPLMFGQKNGARLAKKLWQYLDFAVLESCHQSPSFCSGFRPYLDAKKPVLDIEYSKNLQNSKDEKSYCNLSRANSGDDKDAFCPKISGTALANMSRVIKLDYNDYGLNGCTQKLLPDMVGRLELGIEAFYGDAKVERAGPRIVATPSSPATSFGLPDAKQGGHKAGAES